MKAQALAYTKGSNERRIFLGLIFLIMFFAALYIYFVSTSVVHILIRKEVESDIARQNSEIGELESSYIKRQALINREYAYSLGYQQVTEKQFVARNSALGKSLTVNQ